MRSAIVPVITVREVAHIDDDSYFTIKKELLGWLLRETLFQPIFRSLGYGSYRIEFDNRGFVHNVVSVNRLPTLESKRFSALCINMHLKYQFNLEFFYSVDSPKATSRPCDCPIT